LKQIFLLSFSWIQLRRERYVLKLAICHVLKLVIRYVLK